MLAGALLACEERSPTSTVPSSGVAAVPEGPEVVLGRVLDAHGDPLAGANVTGIARWSASDEERASSSTRTDEHGAYFTGDVFDLAYTSDGARVV